MMLPPELRQLKGWGWLLGVPHGRLFPMVGGWRILAHRQRFCSMAALTGLAFACGPATMMLEAFLPCALWGKYDPFETLGFNFGMELGMAPAWEMPGAGLALAAMPAIFRSAPGGWRRRVKADAA